MYGPCRSLAPVFEAASEKHPDVVFAKVNIEEPRGLAAAFQVRSIPTLMVFREGFILYAQPGALPASIDKVIEKTKEVDMEQIRRAIAERETSSPSS